MKQLTPEQIALIEEAKANNKANKELLAEVDKKANCANMNHNCSGLEKGKCKHIKNVCMFQIF